MALNEGRGHLRASHADREQAIEMLKAAFAQEQLDKAEFETRAGQALASRTYAELAAVTAGIPARLTAGQLRRTRVSRTGVHRDVATCAIGAPLASPPTSATNTAGKPLIRCA